MGQAFQIVVGGQGNTVVSTIEAAALHLAAIVDPAGADGLHDLSQYPAAEIAGSFLQRIRYAAQGEFETLAIIEHDTDAPAGYHTDRMSIDLVNDFDPAFELQSALYAAWISDKDLSDLAYALKESVHEGIEDERHAFKDDAAFVSRLRAIGERMGGLTVVPESGDPAEILKALPFAVRHNFEEIAARAFPDKTPSLAA